MADAVEGHVRVVGRLAHDERSLQDDLGVAGEAGGVEFGPCPAGGERFGDVGLECGARDRGCSPRRRP